ncbi:unnamed protein product, partial [Didymodactylos carnosus]
TFPNCWVCPGGHIELGESFLEAGTRELKEETGIVLDKNELETYEILTLWE